MNTAVQAISFPDNFAKKAVIFIDSFCINWHGIDSLGDASNFFHSFKGITERFQNLATDELLTEIALVQCIDSPDSELGFTTQNRDRLVAFLKDVKAFQEEFLSLNNNSDFIDNLQKLKKQSRQLNFQNAREIIYENFLA